MKVWRRVLSVVLSVVMVTSLLTGFATEKHTASAAPAGTTDKFTKEEFRDCYAKVLLSAVGHGYRDGSGYGGAIRKDSGSGTPRDPWRIGDTHTMYYPWVQINAFSSP